MTANTKIIELVVMRKADVFEVKSIKNSTWVIPGDFLTRDNVKEYCEHPDWQVTIVDNDLIQTVIGGFAGGLGKLIP